MRSKVTLAILCAGLFGMTASCHLKSKPEPSFERISTFASDRNSFAVSDNTAVEIVAAATTDGKILVYTDPLDGVIGFIDISNLARPQLAGTVNIDQNPSDATDYSPTSADVLGNSYAMVAADTSPSKTAPSGRLVVIDIASRAIIVDIDLGGQPDSVRVSPNGQYAVITVENERDEALCVGGRDDGLQIVEPDNYVGNPSTTTEGLCEDGGGVSGGMPQTELGNPPGYLVVIETTGPPASWIRHDVGLTGLANADAYPDDPEPGFVDINKRNQAVVALQENNHIVIIDLPTRTVVGDFPAGTVSLDGIDTAEDGVIALTDGLSDVPREPDAIAWVREDHIATANEGDLIGGSRGYSIFDVAGRVRFDSGTSLEELAVHHGHYPEAGSDSKCTEPEAIESATFGPHDQLFIGSERGGFVAVYRVSRTGQPTFLQLLPAPRGRKRLLAIPHRNLLIVSGDEEGPGFAARFELGIYELKPGRPTYP